MHFVHQFRRKIPLWGAHTPYNYSIDRYFCQESLKIVINFYVLHKKPKCIVFTIVQKNLLRVFKALMAVDFECDPHLILIIKTLLRVFKAFKRVFYLIETAKLSMSEVFLGVPLCSFILLAEYVDQIAWLSLSESASPFSSTFFSTSTLW